jgi:predicted nucleotide-binding protein
VTGPADPDTLPAAVTNADHLIVIVDELWALPGSHWTIFRKAFAKGFADARGESSVHFADFRDGFQSVLANLVSSLQAPVRVPVTAADTANRAVFVDSASNPGFATELGMRQPTLTSGATSRSGLDGKPRLFVASSVEGIDVAYALQENLEHQVEVTVWDQDIFQPTRTPLTSLLNALPKFDGGAFVFTPDDTARIRSGVYSVARDNVIFELGLFFGSHDDQKVFLVMPRDVTDFHLPTDLLGITPVKYESRRSDGNLRASLGPACNQIRRMLCQRAAC